jgi:hypothetical protein
MEQMRKTPVNDMYTQGGATMSPVR